MTEPAMPEQDRPPAEALPQDAPISLADFVPPADDRQN